MPTIAIRTDRQIHHMSLALAMLRFIMARKIAHGIYQGQVLHQCRHVFDWSGKSGQDDGGNQEEERAQQALLLWDRE